jgi:hypothetical protein
MVADANYILKGILSKEFNWKLKLIN